MRTTATMPTARSRHHYRFRNHDRRAVPPTGWWSDAQRDARQSTKMLSTALLLSMAGWGSIILALVARFVR